MRAHLEFLCAHVGILRVGGCYGEPWTWAVTVLLTTSPITLLAAQRGPTWQEWRIAECLLRLLGYLAVQFTRQGDPIPHVLRLRAAARNGTGCGASAETNSAARAPACDWFLKTTRGPRFS